MTTIVWFRQDLRTADHPALLAAAEAGPVLPVFVWHPEAEGHWSPGGAGRWWLDRSLRALSAQLSALGSPLVVRAGDPASVLPELARACGAARVHWSRRYEPAAVRQEEQLIDALEAAGIGTGTFNSALLYEPHEPRTGSGMPYKVFTPFWKACRAIRTPERPHPAPKALRAPDRVPEGVSIDSLGLRPAIAWDAGLAAEWNPGEAGAAARLQTFLAGAVGRYADGRDFPSRPDTSRLSPHLHFGEIGPRQAWHAVADAMQRGDESFRRSADKFLSELGWREFAHHVLANFPRTADEPLRAEFTRFPWRTDPAALRAWQRGRTGYPLIDAGMRELWHTGWMHNRVRMVVASFLVKHLLVSWNEGAAWFWDTLVDADLANNSLGWQWAGGCGADAAPYFRIFNPVTQGQKFDEAGAYIRRWVPELAKLPDDALHAPWDAPPLLLAQAGVDLGVTYPRPIVDHAAARAGALAALAAFSGKPLPDKG